MNALFGHLALDDAPSVSFNFEKHFCHFAWTRELVSPAKGTVEIYSL